MLTFWHCSIRFFKHSRHLLWVFLLLPLLVVVLLVLFHRGTSVARISSTCSGSCRSDLRACRKVRRLFERKLPDLRNCLPHRSSWSSHCTCQQGRQEGKASGCLQCTNLRRSFQRREIGKCWSRQTRANPEGSSRNFRCFWWVWCGSWRSGAHVGRFQGRGQDAWARKSADSMLSYCERRQTKVCQ